MRLCALISECFSDETQVGVESRTCQNAHYLPQMSGQVGQVGQVGETQGFVLTNDIRPVMVQVTVVVHCQF